MRRKKDGRKKAAKEGRCGLRRRKRAPQAGAGDGTEEKTCREEGGRSTLVLTTVHGGVSATGGSLMDLSRYPAVFAVCHWRGPAQGGAARGVRRLQPALRLHHGRGCSVTLLYSWLGTFAQWSLLNAKGRQGASDWSSSALVRVGFLEIFGAIASSIKPDLERTC